MATIRKNRDKWQAIIRRTGYSQQSKSFINKAEARKWARQREAQLDKGQFAHNSHLLDTTTVLDLLTRYKTTVTINKKGRSSEDKRIDSFSRQSWASLKLNKVTSNDFTKYRDRRLKEVQPSTVRRDLGLLRAIFEISIKEWSLPLRENPLVSIKKPKEGEARNRRLETGELNMLLSAAEACTEHFLEYGILIAIETGMRRGELLRIKWKNICFDSSTLFIERAKNGHSRNIPLSSKAVTIFKKHKQNSDTPNDLVFKISPNAFQLSWQRCKKRVAKQYPAILDLRFHDLRHEAISRFFELGLNVPEVALISGHRDPRMLFRYTHLRAEDLVSKINGKLD